MSAQTITMPAVQGIYWRMARVISLYIETMPNQDTIDLCQVLIDDAFLDDHITYRQACMLSSLAKSC